jgi:hypothetical protein
MKTQHNWSLNSEDKVSKKLIELISSQALNLEKSILMAKNEDDKYAAVFQFYRKYYTLTLKKINLEAGINRSPTRDLILDYPWKELKLDRFDCLKIWEKINH